MKAYPIALVLSEDDVHNSFRKGLFDEDTLKAYTDAYAASSPYLHSVISDLVDDALLRSVRQEIRSNVQFTPKETDIYRIHQSGDLANLDGLDDGALQKLPTLLRLRDVLYSQQFRKYVAHITQSGALSGKKTDMAINVYTPGCHLLCHDDVIGSRRVSYILYLTDPDIPWQDEWGGGLRLFPTQSYTEANGETTKVPLPDYEKTLPPRWNQLSFFAVQPGESFHDVEEVYHASSKEELERNGGRVRMAISGWYHIPQAGEEGYVKGAEEKWGANSSLMQLQGHPDKYDLPQDHTTAVASDKDAAPAGFEAEDLDFLLKYMAPTYLTPDTMEQIAERFEEESSVVLDGLLCTRFADKVKACIEAAEKAELPARSEDIERQGPWKVSRPPHKHRYLFLEHQESDKTKVDSNFECLREITEVFLPSRQFRHWLQQATKCQITDYNVLTRRFRKGLDYALASGHEDAKASLEIGLGLTPTIGWGTNDAGEESSDDEGNSEGAGAGTSSSSNNASKADSEATHSGDDADPDFGGQLVYMATDEDDGEDAAIYKASSNDDGDDNVLFTAPPAWNRLHVVLRDQGVLRFVKFLSQGAPGDRWDVLGRFGIEDVDENDVSTDGSDEEAKGSESEQDGDEFKGFSDAEGSDGN